MGERAMTENRSQVLAGWGLAGLSALGVALALFEIGGPGVARVQREDDKRMEDIQALQEAVYCEAERRGAVPEGIGTSQADCAWMTVDRRDPVTGEPYLYEARVDGWSVCAEMADPDSVERARYRGLVPGDDTQVCATGLLPPPAP